MNWRIPGIESNSPFICLGKDQKIHLICEFAIDLLSISLCRLIIYTCIYVGINLEVVNNALSKCSQMQNCKNLYMYNHMHVYDFLKCGPCPAQWLWTRGHCFKSCCGHLRLFVVSSDKQLQSTRLLMDTGIC